MSSALSTELAYEKIRAVAAPEMLTPQLGRNAEQEKEEIVLAYPEFTPGKRQVIQDPDREMYEYHMAAAAYYADQKDLAQNRIRLALGDAQYGVTPQGIVFVERRIYPRKGYNVVDGIVDSVNPVKH